MKEISIVIPFFNEEKIIIEKIDLIYSYLVKHFSEFEVIFVDDGSTDSSKRLAQSAITNLPHASFLSYLPNAGRGNAIHLGLAKAKGKIQGYMDVDLEIGLNNLKPALKKLSAADIVIASKFAPGAKVKTPMIRKISSMVFNILVNLILQTNVKDHQAGFKFFRKNVLNDILELSQQKGWLWDIEILYLAKKKQYTVVELPVEITYGYRNLRKTFLLDFLKMPLFVVSLKRSVDKKFAYGKN